MPEPALMLQGHRPFWILLATVCLIRLLTIGHFGLGVDEAHYVLYGLHPALSYFDHPPLVGWTEKLFTTFLGVNTFAARLPAVLIGAVASIMVYGWLLRIFRSEHGAFWGAAALNAAFLFNALFMMLMPDTLLFLLIIPIMISVIHIETRNRWRDWILLGILLGFSGLSKYTAFLFVIALLIYFVTRRRWDLLREIKMLPAVMIALLIVSPVFIWNAQHAWMSFAFQSAHVSGNGGINPNAFFQSIGAQFGAYSPVLFPVAFYGLLKALRTPANPALFLSGIFGGVILAFFTYNSLYARALPHWTALFYLLFIPIGTAALLEHSRRWRRYIYAAVTLTGLISLLLHAELRFKFLPFPEYKSLHRDLYGWDIIMQKATAKITDPTRQAIALTNWSLASRALYYGRSYPVDIFLIDTRHDQFDLWQKGTPTGRDLLFIATHDFHKAIKASMQCERVEAAGTFDLELNNRKVNTVTLTWCRRFGGIK